MKIIGKVVRNDYLLVFVVSVMMRIVAFILNGQMRLIGDELGFMLSAATVAGRDWSGMSQFLSYYGFGYSLLFVPLFCATNNPYVIYWGIMSVGAVVLGLATVIAYHLLVKHCGVNSKVYAALTSITCSMLALTDMRYINNEPMIVLICMTLMWLLALLIESDDNKKKKNKYTILIILVLSYAIFVHNRLLVLWPSFVLVVIFYAIFHKKKLISMKIGIPFAFFAFVIAQRIVSWMTNTFWNVDDNVTGYLNNSVDATTKNIQSNLLSIVSSDYWNAELNLVMGNAYTAVFFTGGVIIIAMIIMCKFIETYISKNSEFQMELKSSSIVNKKIEMGSLFFWLVLGMTLAGLVLVWGELAGKGQALGYGANTTAIKVFVYIRYYSSYLSIIVLLFFVFVFHNKEIIKQYLLRTVIIFIIVSIYWFMTIVPYLRESNVGVGVFGAYGLYALEDTKTTILLFGFCGFILIAVFAIICLSYYKKNIMVPIVIVLFIIGHRFYYNSGVLQQSFYNLADGGYKFVSGIRNDVDMPDTIYVNLKKTQLVAYQFLLNDYNIKYVEEIPEHLETAIFITSGNIEGSMHDFQCIQLDDNEFLWMKGDSLQRQLEPYIAEFQTNQNTVYNLDIALEEGIMKKFGTLFQLEDGPSTTALISRPTPGEYDFCVSMNAIYAPSESFGTVNIIMDGEVVESTDFVVDEFKDVSVCLPAYVGDTDEVQIRCSFEKNTIVDEFEITAQCKNPMWVVGKEHIDELEELERVMKLTGISLPVRVLEYKNPYSKSVDFSVMKETFGIEQIDFIDSDLVTGKNSNENCYLLVQNKNESQIIFDLVDKYNILWKTQHYTLLVYENEQNTMTLKDNNCIMLSENGVINVNYFRLGEDGELKNNIPIDLPKGAYEITEYHDISSIPQQRDEFYVETINESTGELLSIHNTSVTEVEDMLVGKQSILANDGEFYSFNWKHSSIDENTISQAYISRCNVVYEAGDIIDFSTAGERPFYYTGIGEAEEWGAWSTKLDNTIELNVKSRNSIALDIWMHSFIAQDVTITVNGTELTVLPVGEETDVYSITVPKEYLQDGEIELGLSVEQLCSPNERNGSLDMRELGIGIAQIEFK